MFSATLIKPCSIILFILVSSFSCIALADKIEYKYDALGRLTFVKDPSNGDVDFEYDEAGNRKSVSSGGPNGGSSGGSSGGDPVCSLAHLPYAPPYSCSPNTTWSYGEYQFCQSQCRWQ